MAEVPSNKIGDTISASKVIDYPKDYCWENDRNGKYLGTFMNEDDFHKGIMNFDTGIEGSERYSRNRFVAKHYQLRRIACLPTNLDIGHEIIGRHAKEYNHMNPLPCWKSKSKYLGEKLPHRDFDTEFVNGSIDENESITCVPKQADTISHVTSTTPNAEITRVVDPDSLEYYGQFNFFDYIEDTSEPIKDDIQEAKPFGGTRKKIKKKKTKKKKTKKYKK